VLASIVIPVHDVRPAFFADAVAGCVRQCGVLLAVGVDSEGHGRGGH
jgi:hypothetical protein